MGLTKGRNKDSQIGRFDGESRQLGFKICEILFFSCFSNFFIEFSISRLMQKFRNQPSSLESYFLIISFNSFNFFESRNHAKTKSPRKLWKMSGMSCPITESMDSGLLHHVPERDTKRRSRRSQAVEDTPVCLQAERAVGCKCEDAVV